ncbi:MAG: aldo/keto reductase [Planctomycetota bacterium]|nr:aldo/keto reductase [Planctomycetota bacterium]
MAINHYVTLGRSGLRVSPLCLGAMTFGTEWNIGVEPEKAFALLDAYLNAGGNFIDTANIYSRGHSEKILGDYFSPDSGTPWSGKRDRVVIATKFGGNLFRTDPNAGGSGRKAILDQCDESLRRLRTDYIDLYWMHFFDRHTPIDETMRTLDDLVRAGKVRYLGFSDTPAWKVTQAQYEAVLRNLTPLVALQIEYSLLERTVEGELLPMAKELGLGVTPWSPLKYGILSGKYTRQGRPTEGRGASEWVTKWLTERTYTVIDVLTSIASAIGVPPAQVALAWLRTKDAVASPIIGARTVDQLEENIASLRVRLSNEQVARLDEVSRPQLNFPADFLAGIGAVVHGGLSINGVSPAEWANAPKTDAERF